MNAPRLFIDSDAHGSPCVWENRADHPSAPRCVLDEFDVHDQELWNAIVRLVEGGGVA